ncbi:MAG: hypothetical protein EPN77_19325 [Candidimonas sp.]|nr:MAG: hypothetical protein EPN77_19325 [Candidimonas sp.]
MIDINSPLNLASLVFQTLLGGILYLIIPVFAGWKAGTLLQRQPSLAWNVFRVASRPGRALLLGFTVCCGLAIAEVAPPSLASPLVGIVLSIANVYPMIIGLGLAALLLRASVYDEGGFQIEMTIGRRAKLHVDRPLDKSGVKSFANWLPGALVRCHEAGARHVDLVSTLLCQPGRPERLAALTAKTQGYSDGRILRYSAEEFRVPPLIFPFTLSYWRKYGCKRQGVPGRKWWRSPKVMGFFWVTQRGLRISINVCSSTQQQLDQVDPPRNS